MDRTQGVAWLIQGRIPGMHTDTFLDMDDPFPVLPFMPTTGADQVYFAFSDTNKCILPVFFLHETILKAATVFTGHQRLLLQ